MAIQNLKNSLNISNINEISDDCLVLIFKKLNYEDLSNCRRVCRRWNELGRVVTKSKKIIVVGRYLKQRQFQCLLLYHLPRRIEEFHFFNDNKISLVNVEKQTFFRLRVTHPNLKKLTLSYCNLINLMLEEMPESLQCLSIRNSEINPYYFFRVTSPSFFRGFPYLTCLDVGGVVTFLTSQDLHLFTHLNKLRCFYLEGCFRINNGGIESMTDLIQQLETLDVEGTDISNEGVQIIIKNGVKLKKLFIGSININDDIFNDIYMDMFFRLQTLCLKNTNVSLDTIEKFQKNNKMQTELLSNCDVHENIGMFNGIFKEFYDCCNHYSSHSCPS